MEIFATKRGKRKIGLDGYLYNKKKRLANGYEQFECEQRKKTKGFSGCRATIKVKGEEVAKGAIPHTHSPQPARAEMLRAQQDIKTRVEQTLEIPEQILACSMTNLSQEAAATPMPQTDSIRRTVRKARRRANQPASMTVGELLIRIQYNRHLSPFNFTGDSI